MNTNELWRLHDLQLAGPDMLIDGYDQYNQQENEVVNISPDEQSEDPGEPVIRADDRKTPVDRHNTSS
jgi:hypothetical protein